MAESNDKKEEIFIDPLARRLTLRAALGNQNFEALDGYVKNLIGEAVKPLQETITSLLNRIEKLETHVHKESDVLSYGSQPLQQDDIEACSCHNYKLEA